MKRNFCKFSINKDLFKDGDMGLLARVLDGFIILRAEYSFMYDQIDYDAYHPEAPECPLSHVIPIATFTVSDLGDRFSWEFDCNGFKFAKGFILKELLVKP